jgi:hypothetical protein
MTQLKFTIENEQNGQWVIMGSFIGFGMAIDCLNIVFKTYGGEYRIVNAEGFVIYPINNKEAE